MAPPAPPPLPPAATILNKYQLGRLLGRGSFAKVYEARSIADGSLVAVKIIDKSKTVSAAMEPHILREVQAMRRLQSHPNILRIHEVMATRTKIYLVVELAKGGELLSRIAKGGRLSETAARRYFHQLVSALRFCHQNGVAHRDVKPQNLLLDESGNLKVSDFGLSALPEQLRNGMLHTACGTPAYTAPEVVSRRRGGYDGAKADAWSCGVILFVFLAGFMPFDDGNLIAMYKKMKRREFHFPAWISKQAKSVVFQLLDPDPERRMSIETLIAHKWFKKTVSSKHQSSYFEIDAILKRYSKTDLSMNAFEIISMSSGLDLSGLFEAASKKEKRFTSIATAEAVAERVKQAGSSLGYSVERGKSGAIGLGKGRLILVVEVMEITTSLVVVEVKVMDGGTEFEEGQWRDLTAALGDVVQSDAF